MSDPQHAQAQKALRESVEVELMFCKNELEARDLESLLIQDLKPLYNVAIRKNKSLKFVRGSHP